MCLVLIVWGGVWGERRVSEVVMMAALGALLQALVPGYLKVWGEVWYGREVFEQGRRLGRPSAGAGAAFFPEGVGDSVCCRGRC